MRRATFATFSFFMLISAFLNSCEFMDDDYKAGIYWLEKENNPIQASRSFQRSLNRYPDKWKTHAKLLEALSKTEDAAQMEQAVRDVMKFYPDSARSASVAGPAASLLGEERYNRLASSLEQHHLGQLLAKQGDSPLLLSRSVMSACRGRDTFMVADYFRRLIKLTGPDGAPDSVVQEMNFFVGPARVSWLKHEYKVIKDPDNIEARMALIDVGLITGDSSLTIEQLRILARKDPTVIENPDYAQRLSSLVGIDPFNSKTLVIGWDGSFSTDGKSIVYIKDRGTGKSSDQYLYRAESDGSAETAIMKANQQFLQSLALPRISPDNYYIYFYGSQDKNWTTRKVGRFNFYRIRPFYGSAPEKLTDADLLATIPHFEKDGNILLVRRDVGSTRSSVEVIRLNTKQKSLSQVSRIGEPVISACFTTNGDSIIFSTDRGIFRRSVNGGNIKVDLNWQNLDNLAISLDDRYLLVSTPTRIGLLIDRQTGKPTYIGSLSTPLGGFGKNGELLLTRSVQSENRIVRLTLNQKNDISTRFKQKLVG